MNSPTSYHNSEYHWHHHSSLLLYPYIIHIKASKYSQLKKLINSYKDNGCCIKFSYSPYVCLYTHNHTSMCNTYVLVILIRWITIKSIPWHCTLWMKTHPSWCTIVNQSDLALIELQNVWLEFHEDYKPISLHIILVLMNTYTLQLQPDKDIYLWHFKNTFTICDKQDTIWQDVGVLANMSHYISVSLY